MSGDLNGLIVAFDGATVALDHGPELRRGGLPTHEMERSGAIGQVELSALHARLLEPLDAQIDAPRIALSVRFGSHAAASSEAHAHVAASHGTNGSAHDVNAASHWLSGNL